MGSVAGRRRQDLRAPETADGNDDRQRLHRKRRKMSFQIPQAKLPHLVLPSIRSIPTIPHVGCAGADGTSYIGKQFANLPDLHALLHLKTLKKALDEHVYALIQGELPFVTRPPIYAARAAQLTNEIAELVNAITSIADEVTSNIEDAIGYVD